MGNRFGLIWRWGDRLTDDGSTSTAQESLSVPDHFAYCPVCPHGLIEVEIENTERNRLALAEYEEGEAAILKRFNAA